jgi:hypothetical protein
LQQQQRKPAIRRYLGWWVQTRSNKGQLLQGQIISVSDLDCTVRINNGSILGIEKRFANSAILDPYITRLYPSDDAMQDAQESRA